VDRYQVYQNTGGERTLLQLCQLKVSPLHVKLKVRGVCTDQVNMVAKLGTYNDQCSTVVTKNNISHSYM